MTLFHDKLERKNSLNILLKILSKNKMGFPSMF